MVRGREERDVLDRRFGLGWTPLSRSREGERSILRICLLEGSGWKGDAESPKT